MTSGLEQRDDCSRFDRTRIRLTGSLLEGRRELRT